jgi:hypothetical protein
MERQGKYTVTRFQSSPHYSHKGFILLIEVPNMAFWRNLNAYDYVIYLLSVLSFIYNWVLWLFNNGTRNIQNNTNRELEGVKTSVAVNTRKFKVYIYKEEHEKIKNWVLQKDGIETGGDLFGLWLDQHNVVVQFVLGPGKNCRRTTTSFYQDIDYLASVGNYITRNHGLCNIGQWHSHHRLNLPRPSAGDEDTVWNNMPSLEMERYVVFIATIKDSGRGKFKTAHVNCFLFEIENERKLPVLEGKICVIEQEGSPLRMCSDLTALAESGLEHDDNSVSVVIDI